MSNYDLCHEGILGMKWGIRRYQYPDGTWTEEGKLRRRQYENYDASGNYYNDGSSRRVYYSKFPEDQYTTMLELQSSLAKMDDAELQAAINRLNLEKKYKDLVDDLSKDKNKRKTSDFLNDVKLGVAVATSVIGMGSALKKFMEKPKASNT